MLDLENQNVCTTAAMNVSIPVARKAKLRDDVCLYASASSIIDKAFLVIEKTKSIKLNEWLK